MLSPVVVVVGSCNMDLVARVPRLPQRGETIAGLRFDTFLGGKGLNQAVAAQRMGASVAMVARVGADDFGQRMQEALGDEGVDAAHVATDREHATGTAHIVVEDGTGDNTIVVVPGANGALAPNDVDQAADLIKSARVLLLQLEVPLATVVHAAQIAHAAGVRVVLTPAPVQPLPNELLQCVDVLVPNQVEIGQLLQQGIEPLDGARALIARGCRAIVVTLGAQGALLVTGGMQQQVPPFSVPVVDTVAAGDAFAGALAALLAEGRSIQDAVRYAGAGGALAVTKAGALPSLPQRADVEQLVIRKSKRRHAPSREHS